VPSSDLIIDDVLFYLDLVKIVELADLVCLCDTMILFYPKLLLAHSEMAQADPKSMHSVMKRVRISNNEAVLQLHDGVEPAWWVTQIT
jgi:hypothetical protein